MVKVLLTGGSGLLGRYLILTKPQNIDLAATYHTNAVIDLGTYWYNLDIENYSMLSLLCNRIKPDIIIHAAAIGSVDYCEQNYSPAFAVNVIGTEKVARVANECGARLIFISSNAVYDGENPPYKEGDFRRAVNRYGAMKIQAEDHVILNCNSWAVIRPILMYGWPWPGGRENWATTVVKRLREGFPLKVVNDTVTQPTYAKDAAEAIWHIIQTTNKNVEYNVADGYYKGSLFGFALECATVFGLDETLIEPVSSSHFQGLAERPVDTTYNTNRLQRSGFVITSSRLESMREEHEYISSHIH